MASTAQANGMSAATTARASPIPQRGVSFTSTTAAQPQAHHPQQTTTANATSLAGQTGLQPPPANQAVGSPRPHDARTIHLILASVGVTAYQERVPLQLLDFAYRYTAGILGDAAHLAAEGYTASSDNQGGTSGGGTGGGGRGGGRNKQSNEGDVTLPALRLATSSRLGFQFAGSLPKQAMLEVAEERNRIALPDVSKTKVFGVRLPEERFLLSNRAWGFVEDLDMGKGGNDGEAGEADDDEMDLEEAGGQSQSQSGSAAASALKGVLSEAAAGAKAETDSGTGDLKDQEMTEGHDGGDAD